MRIFTEKLFILIFCLYNTYNIDLGKDLVIFLLISIIISILLDLFNSKGIKVLLYIIFFSLCLYNNTFMFYLPLILYNIYIDFKFYSLISFFLILVNFSLSNLLASSISIYLSIMTDNFNLFLNKNKLIRDELREDTISLKKYNEQLKIDREKNIEIAILSERNRIAREMHDSIGHSISSSILQVEALKVVTNNNMSDSLDLLQSTLDNGMDDIRSSIHNLYNESLNLKNRIEKLCTENVSLDIDLVYGLEEPLSYELKFDILSIVRESITNTIKHSDANKMTINLLTQPKFYSIIIKDNGKDFDKDKNLLDKGIGLFSMDEIARKYNGLFNYEYKNGFKLHITLMRG